MPRKIAHRLNTGLVAFGYFENDNNASASIGVDGNDGDKVKISASTSIDVDPTTVSQIEIDPGANGNILLNPNGTGTVNIDYATPNAVAYYGTAGALQDTGALTDGQLVIGSTGNPPVASSVTSSDSTLTVSGGAGTLDIVLNSPVTVPHGGTGAISLTDHGVLVGSGTTPVTQLAVGTDGQVLLGATGADPAFASLTSSGGSIVFTPGANSLNLEASMASVFQWTEITTTPGPTQMAVNNGYIANAAGTVGLTLPATASVGDVIKVTQKGAGLADIQQNAGQTIHFGGSSSTTGAGGTVTSTSQYDSIELVCTTTDTDFIVQSSIGNWTIV